MAENDRKVLFIRVPPGLHAKVVEQADADRRSVSATVELILADHFAAKPRP